MNGSFPRSLLVANFMLLSQCASAEVRLVGVVREDASVWVSLVDTESHQAAWVAIGETFAGRKVMAVSEKYDEVTLRRNASEERVRLRGAIIEHYDDPGPKARDERFHEALSQVLLDRIKNHSRSLTVDEFVQLAAKYGRVVLRREAGSEQDVIVIGLPGTDSDSRGKDMFRVTDAPKDGSRGYTLMIR